MAFIQKAGSRWAALQQHGGYTSRRAVLDRFGWQGTTDRCMQDTMSSSSCSTEGVRTESSRPAEVHMKHLLQQDGSCMNGDGRRDAEHKMLHTRCWTTSV
eukprot:1158900-Pelagomonas_calceolata.AAC.8